MAKQGTFYPAAPTEQSGKAAITPQEQQQTCHKWLTNLHAYQARIAKTPGGCPGIAPDWASPKRGLREIEAKNF
ncbi:hypothetical protein, partial [Endozoicomonas sp. ONNA2]|uniref:hypothetical protein n=1 Tax=Endozoicomonas sp. ONNA2 TaxID=2828741 RepID=UPI002147BB7F